MEKFTVYTKPTCPFSKKLKKILDDKKIPYYEVNVKDNMGKQCYIVKKEGHTPTPQVDFGGEIVYDYANEEQLADLIQEKMKKFK